MGDDDGTTRCQRTPQQRERIARQDLGDSLLEIRALADRARLLATGLAEKAQELHDVIGPHAADELDARVLAVLEPELATAALLQGSAAARLGRFTGLPRVLEDLEAAIGEARRNRDYLAEGDFS